MSVSDQDKQKAVEIARLKAEVEYLELCLLHLCAKETPAVQKRLAEAIAQAREAGYRQGVEAAAKAVHDCLPEAGTNAQNEILYYFDRAIRALAKTGGKG